MPTRAERRRGFGGDEQPDYDAQPSGKNAQLAGGLGEIELSKVPTNYVIWLTRGDWKVCPHCRLMEGVILPTVTTFTPPLHLRCRCRLRYVVVDSIPPAIKIQLAGHLARTLEALKEHRIDDSDLNLPELIERIAGRGV